MPLVQLLALQLAAVGAPPVIRDNPGEQIAGPPHPEDAASVAEWRASLVSWKQRMLAKIHYNGSIYDVPELQWTQTSYIQPQIHPYDRYFFDPVADNYTVQKFLDDVNRRYGGVDSILMWPTYTNIGADARSQFDLFEAMPGGIAAVRTAIDELHAAGVKVLIPYNPWDSGTARCGKDLGGATCGGDPDLPPKGGCGGPATAARPGVCDARIIDGLLKGMNGDGFNGDTMGLVPAEFYVDSVRMRHPIAIEPEGGGSASEGPANWDTMGWGYWKYPTIPSVDSWKFLDPRRMTNICERWSKDHTNALQYALFNGDGFESWENVWGTWNGITQRDGEQIRRVGAILRFLGSRRYLQSQGWVPHSPTAAPATVFASLWPLGGSGSTPRSAAWTVVNRDAKTPHSGAAINVTVSAPAGKSWHYYDLWHGVELPAPHSGTIALSMEAAGYGAVLATTNSTADDPALAEFIAKMKVMSVTPIQSLSPEWHYELQQRVPIAPAPAPSAATPPPGMVAIPGGPYRFAVRGIEIEGSGTNIFNNPFGVDFQFEFEPRPNRFHVQWTTLKPYFIDKYPVTQEEFAKYLKVLPNDTYHFLANWDWTTGPNALPKPFSGNGSVPVTYLGIDEARAYCKSVGKRLPREEEWQFAGTGRNSTWGYPWGEVNNASLYPKQVSGYTLPGATPVGTFSPEGDSGFGVGDLLGNVWQYTDEFEDSHTRSVSVRGGSNYRPSGSMWYFPNQANLNTHNKYFLMNARYERAGTIGFRCAADVPSDLGKGGSDECNAPLCGGFVAAPAFVDLPQAGSLDWVAWSANTSRHGGDGNAISAITAVGNASLAPCTGGQYFFSWSGGTGGNATGANTSGGLCQKDGDGVLLRVTPPTGKRVTLSLYAGSQFASHFINATLLDSSGKVTGAYTEILNATVDDLAAKVWYNVRWDLSILAASAGTTLHVALAARASNGHFVPQPPPPPLAPCPTSLCGAIETLSPKGSIVDLSEVGSLDWAYWGGTTKKVATIAGPTLHYSVSGAAVPSDGTQKADFNLAGGATLIGSKTAGLTDLRSGGPGQKAVVTLTAHLDGTDPQHPKEWHSIESVSMTFRYIAGYGCAGTAKPCSGAPTLSLVLVDAITMSDLATVYSSPPLGNYSYGSFTGYSPPITVDARELKVSTPNPVLLQLRIVNNKRNLQLQLYPKTGLNASVTWSSHASTSSGGGCGPSCIAAKLTTTKCGLSRSLIQPLQLAGTDHIATPLDSMNPTTFRWHDGVPEVFEDGVNTGVDASGRAGAGFTLDLNIPSHTKADFAVRVYIGRPPQKEHSQTATAMGGASFSASLVGGGAGATFNQTVPELSESGTAWNGIAVLRVPPSGSNQTLRCRWTLLPGSTGPIEIQGAAMAGAADTLVLSGWAKPKPAKNACQPPSSGVRTLIVQAATLVL